MKTIREDSNLRKLFMFYMGISILLCGIISCATTPPDAKDEVCSAIAISVHLDSLSFQIETQRLSGVENVRIDNVFFIMLDDMEDTILKRELLVSNYVHQPLDATFQIDAADSFCMNVEPGIYAAVGAVGTGRTSGQEFVIYFPEEMIEASKTRAYPNTITYMGKYMLHKAMSLNIVDKLKLQVRMETTREAGDDPQVFYPENYAFDMIKLPDGETVFTKYERPLEILPSLDKAFRAGTDEMIFWQA